MHKISAVIITYNEESRIQPTLESIKWCDEIMVVDSCSTDRTVSICEKYPNCKVFIQPFLGYGLQKKFAVDKATNNWILSIDADEVLSESLANEIKKIMSEPVIKHSGFFIPITMVFMNKVFKYGAENKCLHLRFFNKNDGNFDTQNLHEVVTLNGSTSKLKNEMLHYSYYDIHHYIQKMNNYTCIYANDAIKKNKIAGQMKSIFRFKFEFIRQYFIKCNFLNGYPGFVWSLLSSYYVFVKLVKLYEKNLYKTINK